VSSPQFHFLNDTRLRANSFTKSENFCTKDFGRRPVSRSMASIERILGLPIVTAGHPKQRTPNPAARGARFSRFPALCGREPAHLREPLDGSADALVGAFLGIQVRKRGRGRPRSVLERALGRAPSCSVDGHSLATP